jgi:predicted  nucleic acid-binding Zn-ribbon protein
VVAECERCGAAYAAEQWSDGKIRLIGRSGCRCGQASFVAIEADDDDAQKTTPE